MQRLAYVVSSHGFGHAARSCAVIEALWRATAADSSPPVYVSIFGQTPEWFFHQSLGASGQRGSYEVLPAATDIGLVQSSALREDVSSTARALEDRLPFEQASKPLADAIKASGAAAVVCDISPWGLAAAHRLGLPSVLVENFTWDWIYDGYPELQGFVERFRHVFDLATLRVQTDPLCRPSNRPERTTVITPPVSRTPRTDRRAMRQSLGVADQETLVMLTMGGVAWSYDHLEALATADDHVWVVAGASDSLERHGRHVFLPHHSPLYHPDLVHAADVVVGKLGYSTVAEVAAAGTRLAYVPRPTFPESPRLEAWVRQHLTASRIEPEAMEAASWFGAVRQAVDELRVRPARPPTPNGADRVAKAILRRIQL